MLYLNCIPYFYCFACNESTLWSYGTLLSRAAIDLSTIENLISLCLDNKNIQNAEHNMNTYFKKKISKNTISKYFNLFSRIVMQYYCDAHEKWVLTGHIEIDESILQRLFSEIYFLGTYSG